MDNISFELYKIFYYVAKTKNITKASEILLISQPAITQTIKKLESELNYKLFYRTSRGVELTEHGEELFNRVKNSVECLGSCKESLDKFNNEEIKTLRIGGGTTLLKHNSLEGFKKFKKKYPDVKLEVTKGITSELLKMLKDNLIDLVLFNMPIENDENIDYEIIETFQDVFVANSEFYNDIRNIKYDIKDLNKLPLVLQAEVSSSRKFLNQICKKNNVILNEAYDLESYDLVLSFVKAGLGIGFVNRNHVIDELNNGELFELNINYDIPERQIGIAYNKKNINNKLIKEFIKLINKK